MLVSSVQNLTVRYSQKYEHHKNKKSLKPYFNLKNLKISFPAREFCQLPVYEQGKLIFKQADLKKNLKYLSFRRFSE